MVSYSFRNFCQIWHWAATGIVFPGLLGMALCDGYDAMGFAMSKPNLRAELEADLKR